MAKAAAAGDADAYLAQNWRFHSLIYRTAARPILVGIIEGLWMRVGPVDAPLRCDRPGTSPRRWSATGRPRRPCAPGRGGGARSDRAGHPHRRGATSLDVRSTAA
jgi:hypothetical protein